MHINDFSKYSSFKKNYLTIDRKPFFELGAEHIGKDDKIILDIGSGEGDFFNYLKNKGVPVNKIYLLDGNRRTVEKNKELTSNSIFYLAPEKLPFDDLSVDLIHISHLFDHIWVNDIYEFLQEINRVLRPGGTLVISTPLLWPNFYDDLTHTKPYNPYVFYKYFVHQGRHSHFDKIDGNYTVANLVYRYYEPPLDEGWSSTVPGIDFFFISFRRVLRKLSIKRLRKNGYTLVLKKDNEPVV
jgi:SAM-dependent methyltransferase